MQLKYDKRGKNDWDINFGAHTVGHMVSFGGRAFAELVFHADGAPISRFNLVAENRKEAKETLGDVWGAMTGFLPVDGLGPQ